MLRRLFRAPPRRWHVQSLCTAAVSDMQCVEYVRESGDSKRCRAVLGRRPVPAIADDEVLIRVEAAGINRPDLVQRDGLYPAPKGVTDVPGLEVCGRVERVGRGCARWQVGDRVAALVAGGGYAEYCSAHHGSVLPAPEGAPLTPVQFAALPETLFTVWFNLFHLGKLARGDTLLVHGAAGGIGTMCVGLASRLGVRVLAVVSDDSKAAPLRALGADAVINGSTEDFVEASQALTGGRGVSLVLDMFAGDSTDRNLQALARGGRLVVIGLMSGPKSTIGMHRIMLNQLTVTGSTLRAQPAEVKQRLRDELEERVWGPLVLGGDLRAQVAATYPLAQVQHAQAALESRALVGKVVLEV